MTNGFTASDRREHFRTMFDERRFKTWLSIIVMFLYFPFGLMIATARIFFGIQVFLISQILPESCFFPRSVLKMISAVLGFIVIQTDSKNYQDTAKVLVANHITNFDHVAILLSKKCIVPNVEHCSPIWNSVMGYTDFGAKDEMQTVVEKTRKHTEESETPVLVFPEGLTTNGKSGLLKFKMWPFTLSSLVQPLVIKVYRPSLLNIPPSTLESGWFSDLFWFIFLPYTLFIIRFLPVVEKGNKTADEFCKEVQSVISTRLKLKETPFTSYDVAEYIQNKSK